MCWGIISSGIEVIVLPTDFKQVINIECYMYVVLMYTLSTTVMAKAFSCPQSEVLAKLELKQ